MAPMCVGIRLASPVQ
nr:unnamed protein product [Digitaria exilis]